MKNRHIFSRSIAAKSGDFAVRGGKFYRYAVSFLNLIRFGAALFTLFL
jgi:hypothetical protein